MFLIQIQNLSKMKKLILILFIFSVLSCDKNETELIVPAIKGFTYRNYRANSDLEKTIYMSQVWSSFREDGRPEYIVYNSEDEGHVFEGQRFFEYTTSRSGVAKYYDSRGIKQSEILFEFDNKWRLLKWDKINEEVNSAFYNEYVYKADGTGFYIKKTVILNGVKLEDESSTSYFETNLNGDIIKEIYDDLIIENTYDLYDKYGNWTKQISITNDRGILYFNITERDIHYYE